MNFMQNSKLEQIVDAIQGVNNKKKSVAMEVVEA